MVKIHKRKQSQSTSQQFQQSQLQNPHLIRIYCNSNKHHLEDASYKGQSWFIIENTLKSLWNNLLNSEKPTLQYQSRRYTEFLAWDQNHQKFVQHPRTCKQNTSLFSILKADKFQAMLTIDCGRSHSSSDFTSQKNILYEPKIFTETRFTIAKYKVSGYSAWKYFESGGFDRR